MCAHARTHTRSRLYIDYYGARARARQLCSRMRVQLLSFERGRVLGARTHARELLRARSHSHVCVCIVQAQPQPPTEPRHDTGARIPFIIFTINCFCPVHHGAPSTLTETYHYRNACATPQIAHECVRLCAHIGNMLCRCCLAACLPASIRERIPGAREVYGVFRAIRCDYVRLMNNTILCVRT